MSQPLITQRPEHVYVPSQDTPGAGYELQSAPGLQAINFAASAGMVYTLDPTPALLTVTAPAAPVDGSMFGLVYGVIPPGTTRQLEIDWNGASLLGIPGNTNFNEVRSPFYVFQSMLFRYNAARTYWEPVNLDASGLQLANYGGALPAVQYVKAGALQGELATQDLGPDSVLRGNPFVPGNLYAAPYNEPWDGLVLVAPSAVNGDRTIPIDGNLCTAVQFPDQLGFDLVDGMTVAVKECVGGVGAVSYFSLSGTIGIETDVPGTFAFNFLAPPSPWAYRRWRYNEQLNLWLRT